MENRLPDLILAKYKENLGLIKGRAEMFIDQGKVPPDLVRSMIQTEMILELGHVEFSNEEELEMLRRLEEWYKEKGGFPNPDYLEKRRAALTGESG